MKGVGSMIRQMDMEHICMLMVQNMKVSGETICKMVLAGKPGMMALIMMGSTGRERSKAGEHTCGTTAQNTRECGKKTRSRAKALTSGWTEDATKETGLTIIWMEWACIAGLMGEGTKGSTKMTKNMALACTFGQMAVNILDGGTKASNMVWAFIILDRGKRPNLGCGKMERGLSGLTRRMLRSFKMERLTSESSSKSLNLGMPLKSTAATEAN